MIFFALGVDINIQGVELIVSERKYREEARKMTRKNMWLKWFLSVFC